MFFTSTNNLSVVNRGITCSKTSIYLPDLQRYKCKLVFDFKIQYVWRLTVYIKSALTQLWSLVLQINV